MANQRSRRLRKKLHLGEFKEFGFNVDIELANDTSPEAREAFVDALMAEIIEPRCLAYGGGEFGGFVCGYEKPSATEEDRAVLREWLSSRSEVLSADVSELEDAWYAGIR